MPRETLFTLNGRVASAVPVPAVCPLPVVVPPPVTVPPRGSCSGEKTVVIV